MRYSKCTQPGYFLFGNDLMVDYFCIANNTLALFLFKDRKPFWFVKCIGISINTLCKLIQYCLFAHLFYLGRAQQQCVTGWARFHLDANLPFDYLCYLAYALGIAQAP